MLAQRVLVMAHGRVTLDVANRDLTRRGIVQAAFETQAAAAGETT